MAGTVATQMKAIDFTSDIAKLTQDFTGRQWVFDDIDRWLRESDERFFILTGEPGVGKSAIAAELIQRRQANQDVAAYHFCVAGRAGTIEPDNVLFSIAAQLIKFFPDYAESLVNTIKPLHLSVNVEISIETIKNSVVQGIVIENLHTQHPKKSFDIILRQTLSALPNPPEKPTLILIDSLDEAVTYNEENNLVRLFSQVDDLPSWVRLVFTSRPDERRVLSYFKTHKLCRYHIDELSRKSLEDINTYAFERVKSDLIQVQLRKYEVSSVALVEQLTELSKGNFLYLKVLLDDIESDGQPLDKENLAKLPKKLSEFYHTFLIRRVETEWEGKHQLIFKVLTVAKAPITEGELANLIRSKEFGITEIRQRLRIVQQFLNVEDELDKRTYTLFHQSLRDYLTDEKASGIFYCAPIDGHQQIVERYWRYHPSKWSKCDRYGLEYLPSHLADIISFEDDPIYSEEYAEKLREVLLTFSWLQAKLDRTNVNALMQDYRFLPHNVEAAAVEKVLQQAAHILEEDKTQLAAQLLSRLSEKTPAVQLLLQQIKDWRGYPWLRPLTASLATPNSLLRTLKGHTSPVWKVVAPPDGRIVSGGMDGTFKIWALDGKRVPLNVGEQTIAAESDTEPMYYTAVAVSPTGQHAVAALENGLVKVWDLTTGQLLCSLGSKTNGRWVPLLPENETNQLVELFGHPYGVPFLRNEVICTCLSRYMFKPSHQIILGPNSYRIIDPSNANTPDQCWVNPDSIDALAVTPDGKQFISGSRDGSIKVWDFDLIVNQKDTAQARTLCKFPFPISVLTVSIEGEIVIANRIDNRMWILNTQEGIRPIDLPNGNWRIEALAITSDGRIVSGSTNGTIRVSQSNRQGEAYVIDAHTDAVNALELTRNGLLVSASSDSSIKLWNLNSGSLIHTIGQHYGSYSKSVNAVAITLNEEVVSASEDCTLKVWSLNEKFEEIPSKRHNDEIRSIAVSQDGKVVSASKDGTLKIWNSETGCALHSLQGHTSSVYEVVTQDNMIISASEDGTLKIWHLDSGELLKDFGGYSKLGTISVTPLGVKAVSASEDGIIKLWDLAETVEQPIISVEGHVVRGLAITDEGGVLLGSNNGMIALWKLNESEEANFLTFKGHESSIANMTMAQNGSLISSSDDGTIKVWKLDNNDLIELFCTSRQSNCDVTSITVSNDDKVFFGCRDGDLQMWDLLSREVLWELKGHNSVVSKVAIHPEKLFAVSASVDRSLKVWDFSSGNSIAVFRGDSEFVTCEILPNSETIVVGDVLGQLHFLHLQQ